MAVNKEEIWMAVELFRHCYNCGTVQAACEGLAAFLKERSTKFEGWPTDAGTLRTVHAEVQRQAEASPSFPPQAILSLHIGTQVQIVGREINFEDVLSFALADLRV
jgi:hypothetical protein